MKIRLNFKSNHHVFIFQIIFLTYENRITLQFHIIQLDFTRFTKVKIKLWQYGMIFYKCLKDKAMNIEINQYSYLSFKNNNKQKGTILNWFKSQGQISDSSY